MFSLQLFLENNNLIFHASKINLHNKILNPKIPDNYMTKNNFEENKTPRVSFSKSIDGCLVGLSQNLKGQILNIHIPKHNISSSNIISNNQVKKLVPDAHLTEEVWVLKPIEIIFHKQIKVLKATKPLKYTFGNNLKATTYLWKYKVL